MSEINPVILIQMLMQYHNYIADGNRTFRFVKNNRMCVHRETDEERGKRKSVLPVGTCRMAEDVIREKLRRSLNGQLGRVHIEPAMRNIAVPLQMSVGQNGYGTLPAGSRVDIPEGKFIRAFTYWEKVNDIDLSCFGLNEKGKQTEFSWRSMYANQGDDICFSGDQTNGYNGGSEYYDIDLVKFRKNRPEIRYLVFCDNIYSNGGSTHFKDCTATAGFMIRENMEPNLSRFAGIRDHAQTFDPKTVETSFDLKSDSSFCYMFAIDLEKRQMVWLDIAREGNHAIAGNTRMDWLLSYMTMTDVYNVYDLFEDMATTVTNEGLDVDIYVGDKHVYLDTKGIEVIRSWDTEKILRYLNAS